MKRIFLLLAVTVSCLQAFAFNYSNENECQSNKYVEAWGKLKLVGNQLCSESGEPIQLRGWSTHGRQWNGQLYENKNFLADQKKYGGNIARIAMYVDEGGRKDENWIKNCIDWTAELNMYCLIDWHVLTPGKPSEYMGKDPVGFFGNISRYVQEKGYRHVLYELCNEPNINTDGDIYRPELWEDIKTYANKIMPAIQQNDPNAIVIVGTPQWDQALVHAVEEPFTGYTLNIMYTFHSYVGNQEQYFGVLQTAAKFIPIFVTEWGTTENKGVSDYSPENADIFLDICNGDNRGNVKISWCNWSWSDQGGLSASLSNGQPNTQSGQYIVNQLRKGDRSATEKPSSPYKTQKINAIGESFILMENYDNGGENAAYHESDDAPWQKDAYANKHCNAGIGSSDALMPSNFHDNDCVDVNYIDNSKEMCNIGYILSGEWIKFTIDVEKAGYYHLSAYANSHNSKNRISFMVDNENVIRDLNDKENKNVNVVYLEPFGTPSNDGGYGTWGYSAFRSDFDGKSKEDADYGLYFEKAGTQTLLISFMTECAGMGSLKLAAESTVDINEVECNLAKINLSANNGEILVNISNTEIEKAEINIYSASGTNIFRGSINQNNASFGDFEDGVYFVAVKLNDSIFRGKVVVY